MKIDDEIRIKILEALLRKGAVQPNIRQIQRHTGYHKATIKASLDFLQKVGLLEGYGPKMNFRKFGYKLETKEILQVDLSEKRTFDKFIDETKKDEHMYQLSSLLGSGNWNILASSFYEDVESHHNNTKENYYAKIPGLAKLIKDRQIFYITEPHFKRTSRTGAILEIIKKKKGFS